MIYLIIFIILPVFANDIMKLLIQIEIFFMFIYSDSQWTFSLANVALTILMLGQAIMNLPWKIRLMFLVLPTIHYMSWLFLLYALMMSLEKRRNVGKN